jgi:ankyrin repeat protein
MAIFFGNSDVFNMLVEIPSLLSAVDAYERTALMYAARLGREYMLIRMIMYGLDKIENREELLNLRDKDGKTVLHYVCESTESSEDKVRLIQVLIANGAQVVQDVPYQASIWEISLRDKLIPLQAEVYHKDWQKSVALVRKISQNLLVSIAIFSRAAIVNAMIPHLFTLWNSLPVQACQALFYYAEQLALEGFDSNVVISFDLPSGIYHFSFNLLMLLFIAFVISVNNKPAPFRY